MAQPIVDYSQTQRIVLLIDLHPLFHTQNPNPYLTSILATSKILLTFPSLSSSLFAFKLFFSSLSPLLSASSIHRLLGKPSPASLSFDHPPETLDSLYKTLNSLSASPILTELANSPPRASNVAGSLLQLMHDYAWDPKNEEISGILHDFPAVRSNLVLLLSPIGRSLKSVFEFMNVDVDSELLTNVDTFCKIFCDVFSAVSDAYADRDIHCSWVDVKFYLECSEERLEIDESVLQLGFLKNGVKSLGWAFCSTDAIILGSALVPFELIYPIIGISFNCINSNNFCKPIHAQLNLEISDVSGNPLECNCCDLELLNLKRPRLMLGDIMQTPEFGNSENEAREQDKSFWGQFGHGITKLHIKAITKCNGDMRTEGCSSNLILVRGHSGESGKSRKKYSRSLSFFADRVLEVLSSDMGEFTQRETAPIWEILLSFLCRKGYRALVHLSSGNEDSYVGILTPFTAHLAFLSIVNDRNDDEACKPYAFINDASRSISSRQGTVSSLGYQNRKKDQKHVYQNVSWISFCKAAFECSALELEEAYFASKFSNSKKLRFLKCWMKQIQKSRDDCLTVQDESKSSQHTEREMVERLTGTDQESEQSTPLHSSNKPSRIEGEASLVSGSETSEAFFSNLAKKMQDGLESEGVDLQVLAERLVNLSIYWLHQKNEADNIMESQTSDDSRGKTIAGNLIKLLKEPKAMKENHKDNDPTISASDSGSTSYALKNIVREYELQILLRMEILRSVVAESIEASTKRKLVKQICLLLEIIQYLVEGGFHGHVSLYDYVEKTIKARYSHVLGNVVNKIYAQMDLLPYSDENESLILLLNSEDSNHSWREKERHEMAETNRIHESFSAEDESSQPLEQDADSPQDVKREEQARKLSEAQERRERARRFVSFTTWVPDLQRVWAPKQPKAMSAKFESQQKKQKRKERHRGNHDVVCETPMIGKTHNGSNPSVSVSKALFQDDR
ncbi:uncharacterized protein LOC130752530 [Actinidia eriantha]|uniref:uncharacterized protein LOC130752530 n=1 Tax=Actinidia eriantha TaxID=165200 RepID=UPI00258C4933|nr:uncharacterized protein LOC130752530 [Actinidia eriantha]